MKRLSEGGRIDRAQPVSITFDGKPFAAYKGDTLASALMAGGQSVIARSFKYHRPRGIYSAGVEEPNALVHLRDGAQHEPNVRATAAEAFDGLSATSQNAWPSLGFDVGIVNNLLSPALGAGFYYKTFIGPFRGTRFWMACEAFIRKSAGMGRATHLADPDTYEKRNAACDVLVVGGGAAGLCAALAAGRAGADVILAEQDFELGGALLAEPVGGDCDGWLAAVKAELQSLANVTILTRTTAFGAYDGDTYALVERVSDHLKAPESHQVRQRYWQVHARRSVLAAGAIERPMVFGGNDRPGVMLASAARAYVNRYAVLPGERILVCANNDSVYPVAADLARAGARVTVADLRPQVPADVTDIAGRNGVTLLPGHGILRADGAKRVSSAMIAPVDARGSATGPARRIAVDLVAVSGGFAPAVHLWSQLKGKPVYRENGACFVAAENANDSMQVAGTAAGASSIGEVIEGGFARGVEAAAALGLSQQAGNAPRNLHIGHFWQRDLAPVWAIRKPSGACDGKAFIDLQHDVKVTDIDQAHLEGYVSVEHLKRYTTSGMATDQGKTSNLNALARMAELRGMTIPAVGTTTFRPPFTPITVGALVGHHQGRHFRPTRLSPLHDWHVENGAHMAEAGLWMRPFSYPRDGESPEVAAMREARHVRARVGMVDVSTLGKIAVQGPDAATFLNRIYVNGWSTLPIGRLRYGVMLREDGFVMDDGATARLGETSYFMSTTTANAAKVLATAEHLLQTAWKDMRVQVTSVTDQWAAFAVAGPEARNLLAAAASGADLGGEALPNNHFTGAEIGGITCRIHRMSYSGELAYEVYVPSGFARDVWETLMRAGRDFDLQPYGTEAMGILRIEKGHIAGAEIDGRTTLKDLGLEGFASTKKPFVGAVLRRRPVLEDPERPTLVGLEIDGAEGAKAGSLLYPQSGEAKGHGDGWVSSATYSPALGRHIALALLKNGNSRHGETIRVVDFVGERSLAAKVVSHHFFDPEGARQNA